MKQKILSEAKSIRGHQSAQRPWSHHPKLQTLQAVLNPATQIKQQLLGRAQTTSKLQALEFSFRSQLQSLFQAVQGGETVSSKKVGAVLRTHYQQALQFGKKAGGAVSVGLPPLTQEDIRWLNTFIRKEMGYWNGFMADVQKKAGRIPYDRRLDMYVQTLRGVFQSGTFIQVPPNTVFDWVTSIAENCPHCLYLARNGPYTKGNIPTIPGTGDTQCRSNCKCKLKPRIVSPLQYASILRGSRSREQIVREMRALTK